MTEQLITFETAKLAKQKGFIPILPYVGWYNSKGEFLGRLDVDEKGTEINFHTYGPHFENFYLDSYIAPTQSLLQKWLREVHSIEIEIEHFDYPNEIGKVYTGTVFSSSVTEEYDDGAEFSTYEEALEDALLDALKLIP